MSSTEAGPPAAAKHLVLVGAGHAHLTVLTHLNRFTRGGCRATVINRGVWHYYSGMAPGMLSGIYAPEEIRFNVKRMTEDRGGRFIDAAVVHVDPDRQILYLERGASVAYDVVSFNTGSRVAAGASVPPADPMVLPVKPIENILAARTAVLERLSAGPLTLCVAGGGPAGIELSANLRTLIRKENGRAEIVLLPGSRLLAQFSGRRIERYVERELRRQEVTVLAEKRLTAAENGRVILSDGTEFKADLLLVATGTEPAPLFRDAGLAVGPDGGLLVDDTLRSVSHPAIFGGGDCIAFAPEPLARVGVHAVRQNPILLDNLTAAVQGRGSYRKYTPQNAFLLILNMGGGRGVLFRNGLVWRGKAAFLLKDFIDRRFMKKFQLSGETAGI